MRTRLYLAGGVAAIVAVILGVGLRAQTPPSGPPAGGPLGRYISDFPGPSAFFARATKFARERNKNDGQGSDSGHGVIDNPAAPTDWRHGTLRRSGDGRLRQR